MHPLPWIQAPDDEGLLFAIVDGRALGADAWFTDAQWAILVILAPWMVTVLLAVVGRSAARAITFGWPVEPTDPLTTERIVLHPWSRWEAPVSLLLAVGWTLLVCGGVTRGGGTVLVAMGCVSLFAASMRWRYRSAAQVLGAIVLSLPMVALLTVIGLGLELGLDVGNGNGAVARYVFGVMFFGPPVLWVVARRIGRALTVGLTRFTLEIDDRRVRWRLSAGPRHGEWVVVPHDGLRPRVESTSRGPFLDLGGGDALLVAGVSRVQLGRVLATLEARSRVGDIDRESFDAVRTLTSAHRAVKRQPSMRMVPLVASMLGSMPTLLLVVGTTLTLVVAQNTVGVLQGAGVLVFGAFSAWVGGTYLSDPAPLVVRPRWFERDDPPPD